MRGRNLLLVGLAALVLVAILVRPWSRSHPSILLITIDTTRADHLSCYQSGRASTPTLDGIAADGVLFEHAVTAAPLTLPSHTTILTGVFPPDHGVRDNGFFRLRPEVETVPERLRAAGYRTAAFVSSVILDSKFGLDQGFGVYDDDFDEPLDVGTAFPVSRRAGETVSKALAWLDGVDSEPVFVWTHFYDAHAPYDPPAPFDRAYPGAPYDGEIAYLDLMLGNLIARFRERFGDDLLVLVVADHGESFGEHGEETHGYFPYRSTGHVPLLLSGPGFRGGIREEESVRTADVAATVLAAAGVDVPDAMRGRPLGRILDGEFRDLPCYTEAWTGISFGWSGLRSLRIGDLAFVEGARAELYDLASPGGEDVDVGAARPADLERMCGAMADLLATPGLGDLDSRRDLDPEDAQALVGLGYLNAAGGAPAKERDVVIPDRADPRDRISTYRKLIRLRSLVNGEEWEKALELVAGAAAEDPANPVIRMDRAEVLLHLGRTEEAAEDLRFAAEARLEDPRPPNLLGNLAFARKDLPAAEARFREALARDPNHYFALFRLGMIQIAGGRYGEAVDTYRHVLRLDRGDDARAMNNLGCALVLGDIDKAEGLDLIARAVSEEPDAADLRLSLGDALINAGRPSAAIPHLERAREILGDRPRVLELLERAKGR